MRMTPAAVEQLFQTQIDRLVELDYPALCGLEAEAFVALLRPLRAGLETLALAPPDMAAGTLPFVIVVTDALAPPERAMAAVRKDGRPGVSILRPRSAADFRNIDGNTLPEGPVYLIVDIDRGKQSLNLPPNEAMTLIRAEKRLPLTLEEGVAIVTQFPEFLIRNNCFSLLASRCADDKRVPAIWINGDKQPNLGWCWDGNPHTWLGSASCASRAGPPGS